MVVVVVVGWGGVTPWLNEATARAEARRTRAAGGLRPLQGLIRSRFKRRKHAALQISKRWRRRCRRPPPLNNVHTAAMLMQVRGGQRDPSGLSDCTFRAEGESLLPQQQTFVITKSWIPHRTPLLPLLLTPRLLLLLLFCAGFRRGGG